MAQDNLTTRLDLVTPSRLKHVITLFAAQELFLSSAKAAATKNTSSFSPELGLLTLTLPFIAAAMIPIIYRYTEELTGYFAAMVSGLTLVSIYLTGTGSYSITWIRYLDIQLSIYIDGLSMLLAVLASGIGVLIFLYSPSYMEGKEGLVRYYSILLVFLGSMIGIAISGDLISLFVFWELTSICSFFLIGFYSEKKSSQKAARKSMIITFGGGLMLLISILMINAATGTFSIPELLSSPRIVQEQLRNMGLYIPALVTLIIGAGAKSAQVPLHIWLPDAMEAPTPVSAFLHSATMVKAGVFLVARMRPLFESIEWSLIVISAGFITMIVAGLLAISATDIKELLAYSTASHLGIMMAGFGFPILTGLEAGILHILNHASFKAPLFLVAGIVAHEAGTRKIDELSGLYHYLPVTSLIAVIASLSMAGIPPLNGFQSKELLFKASWEYASAAGGPVWMLPILAVAGGALSFAYSIKFASLFIGRSPEFDIHKPPAYMIIPAVLLLIALTAITAAPGYFLKSIVGPAIRAVSLEPSHLHLSLIPHISPALGMSGVSILLGATLFHFYDRIHDKTLSFLKENQRLTANYWYRRSLDYKYIMGIKTTDTLFHGSLRGYTLTSLGAFSIIALLAFGVSTPAISLETGLSTGGIFVIILAVMGAMAAGKSESHISGVLNLSVLGAMVSIYYILARAPDLALTQLLVETLSLLIFIIILEKLPSFYGDIKPTKKITNGFIAALVGITVTFSTLVATTAEPKKISDFFIENAVPEGGGGNIVNVILVDFRGFDTMGEISVVAMSALSIITLLAMRGRSLWFTEVKEE